MTSNKVNSPVLDSCYQYLCEHPNDWFSVEDLARHFKFDRTDVITFMNIAHKNKEGYPNLRKRTERKNTFFTPNTLMTSGYHTTTIRYRVKE